MLVTTNATTINGTSKLSASEIIATMHCAIKEDGKIVITHTISNKELYDANKELVRADMDEFTTYCRQVEDANVSETVTQEEVAE